MLEIWTSMGKMLELWTSMGKILAVTNFVRNLHIFLVILEFRVKTTTKKVGRAVLKMRSTIGEKMFFYKKM